ncbi:Arachidonate 5-lipoxygenase [Holothuria leucospilota]|uniref:Arachidonate 5-lipoxygenase n=1 Tax=Holothuria leucospilota TaxID=206669 RepID=A0A9Q1CIU6_HOLLE|nr:Arachidonate 5-lipoxygenase [Holothuria leucospilota]
MGNGSSRKPQKIPEGTTHVVTVRTGDKKGAGTDANVKIVLYNEKGDKSEDFKLDARWRDDFERGREDPFFVQCDENFGHVHKIEIWRDSKGILDAWYVDWVKVKAVNSEEESFFPLHRWLAAHKRLRVKEFDSILPQDDDDKERRKEELEEKRKKYTTRVKVPGLLPQIESLPDEEIFSNEYQRDLAKLKKRLYIRITVKNVTTGRWTQPEDILPVYNEVLVKPSGFSHWQCDFAFARQRLVHCNPTWIRRCLKIPEKLAVTDEMLQPFMEGMTIEQAIEAKRLYIVDYSFLDGVECSYGRTIPAPYALFFVNSWKTMLPIAIQLRPEPSETNPVFLPTDNHYTWQLAKMWFNNADCSVHQSCTHLGFTHLVMEAVGIATHRSLSPSHPIFRLLAPHFLYLMAINNRALEVLVSEDGWVDTCMSIGRVGMFNIVKRVIPTWRLDVQGTLPNDLKERGVDDPEALPNYHYRDDALLLYDVILKYATTIVKGHYESSEKIVDDYELQEWARCLTDPPEKDGVGIGGVPGNGKFDNVEDLINTVAPMIFIGSVGHAAANFSQYDDYGFPGNYPAFMYGKPPTDKKPRTEREIAETLPTKKMSLDTLLITRLLSERATKPLGDFEVPYQFDKNGTAAIAQLIEDLKRVGEIIDKRNEERTFPYNYLHPKEIPNAISI